MAGSIAGNSSRLHREASVPRAHRSLNRKIWLPKLVYDALPWFYLSAGLAAVAATLYIGGGPWAMPYTLLVPAACIHLAVFVLARRYRRRDPA